MAEEVRAASEHEIFGEPNSSKDEDGNPRDASRVLEEYEEESKNTAKRTHERLKEGFGEAILSVREFRNEVRVEVAPSEIPEVLKFLRDERGLLYLYLSQVAGAEWHPGEQTPEKFLYVTYDLYSFLLKSRIYIYAVLPAENPCLPSVTSVFPTAEWHEREVYDLFGIKFEGHPDLRRILLPRDYDGHPLLKEYPVKGKTVWELGKNVVPEHYDEIIGTL